MAGYIGYLKINRLVIVVTCKSKLVNGSESMLYKFLSDALSALRLRFAPPVHYRYAPVVVIAILLLMAAVNAVGMTPVFGNSNGALGFALCLTILKVFVLARSMTITLNYFIYFHRY